MLLNTNMLSDTRKLPESLRRSIVSAYGHLCDDDRKFILNHIFDFIPVDCAVYLPYIRYHAPSFLIDLEYALITNNYTVMRYDITVTYPACQPSDIIVADDVSKLVDLLSEGYQDYPMILRLASIDFTDPEGLFKAFMKISQITKDRKSVISVYPEAMLALSRYYDTITTLRINSIGGIDFIYPIQSQVTIFDQMLKRVRPLNLTKALDPIKETTMLELNILTSLVPIEKVKLFTYLLKTIDACRDIIGDDAAIDLFVKDLIDQFENREKQKNPFITTKFNNFRTHLNHPPLIPTGIKNGEMKFQDIIENTTREKIKRIIEDNTGDIEEITNITFDIPEELLSMFLLEFGREYPIIMVALDSDYNMDHDGCNWRHIVHYNDEDLLLFSLKESPKKLYGIHIIVDNGDDSKCTLVQFTGRDNGCYEFIY